MKNICNKTRPVNNPYEVWESTDGTWRWLVLRKYQADDSKLYARALCMVYSPFVPGGEMGDVYVKDYRTNAGRVK